MNVQMNLASFRRRLLRRDRLIGAFVKTPAISTVEILGGAGLDFIIIDQEHAPLDRAAIDMLVPAAHWSGLAPLVRIGGPVPDAILSALDCGATGVLVPHVCDASQASAIVRASHYGPGGRGYSNSSRAAGYGTARTVDHLADCAESVTVIAQIEDREALDDIDGIAATNGIDALFLGLADLTISLGETEHSAPLVTQAVSRIANAARKACKPFCVVTSSRTDANAFLKLGASLFVVLSDQGYLRNGATQAMQDFGTLEPIHFTEKVTV